MAKSSTSTSRANTGTPASEKPNTPFPSSAFPDAPMDPVDLAAERKRRNRRDQRKLAVAIRDAYLHATADEAIRLKRLAQAQRAGIVELQDARACVKTLRQQQTRRAA